MSRKPVKTHTFMPCCGQVLLTTLTTTTDSLASVMVVEVVFKGGGTGQGTWNPLGLDPEVLWFWLTVIPFPGGLEMTEPFRLTLAAYIEMTVVGEICVALHIVAGMMFGDRGLLIQPGWGACPPQQSPQSLEDCSQPEKSNRHFLLIWVS